MKDTILSQIEATDYWDAQVLDFRIDYLGDRLTLFYANKFLSDNTCWKLVFTLCEQVSYQTDASWYSDNQAWRTEPVSSLKGGQLLGYVLQDIVLGVTEKGTYQVDITLANMEISLICREIALEPAQFNRQASE